jgi:hypothetical protein
MGLKRCCRGGIGLNKVGLDGNIFNRNYNGGEGNGGFETIL